MWRLAGSRSVPEVNSVPAEIDPVCDLIRGCPCYGGNLTLGAPQPLNPGGIAKLTTTLTTGSHTLTAVFTPTDPVAFGPSTSPAVSLTVQ
jgi:hypothetical protein